jgi:hypothetical protein
MVCRGKTRLAKWYAPYNDEEKIKLKGEVCIPYNLLPFAPNAFLSSLADPALTIPSGPPPCSTARPKIPIKLRRIPQQQDCLSALRRPLLLRMRRRKR